MTVDEARVAAWTAFREARSDWGDVERALDALVAAVREECAEDADVEVNDAHTIAIDPGMSPVVRTRASAHMNAAKMIAARIRARKDRR